MEQGLRRCLDEDTLQLYYQPKISLNNGKVDGFEALLRWIDADGNYISTEKAITIAEQSDLIHEVGSWVVNTACRQMQQWQQDGIMFGSLSINLSPADLEQPGFLADTIRSIRERDVDPARLEFEITEHSVLKETDVTAKVLTAFRDVGVTIAIDDFGTGYSTFNYLKAIPVNTVKIDRSFVEDMTDIKDDAFIVMSMISMAHGLGINVIAEGIETPEQASMLIANGCDSMQGYLVSRPVPAAEVVGWLANHCQQKEDGYYLHAYSDWLQRL
jgi:EAL domain-containing protein (putative c-di-GMP-specific phosphodiesterase class I)